MDGPARTLVASLRQPRCTGANQCRPCTVLNVGISAVVSAVVGLWF